MPAGPAPTTHTSVQCDVRSEFFTLWNAGVSERVDPVEPARACRGAILWTALPFMPARLLVLGIDAVSPTLLSHWARDGSLPAIRRLMDRGTSGSVRHTRILHRKHVAFVLHRPLPRRARLLPHRAAEVRDVRVLPPARFARVAGTLLETASDAGRRVAVLDVPLTRLDQHLNGLQIVGGGTMPSSASTPLHLRSWMTSSRASAHTRCPRAAMPSGAAPHYEQFVDEAGAGRGRKTQLTLDLLRREDWDLFVQVFTEAHCAGHQCWHIHDPAHPAHDPALLAAVEIH